MRRPRSLHCFVVFALVLAAAGVGHAAALRSSTANHRNAVTSSGGFFLNPIGAEPEQPGDLAPPQLFEIIRPNGEAFTISRLSTSCSCTSLEADQTSFAEGEPAYVRLRNVRATPPAGTMYAVYVQLSSPIRTILRFDTFMRSSQFIPAAEGEAPTRGNIVADGVYEPAETEAVDDDIEIIVPKADNYIPDTSEYTLKKRAEAEAEAAAEAAAKAAGADAGDAADAVKSAVSDAAEAVADRAEAAVDAVVKAAEETRDAAEKAAEPVVSTVIENIEDIENAVAEEIEQAAEGAGN